MAESPAETSVRPTSRQVCPRCGLPAFRAHRRTRDRLLGYFRDVRRYRCRAPECGWHGLLVDAGTATAAGARGSRWRGTLLVLGALLVPVAVVSVIVYWNTLREKPEPPPDGFTSTGTPLASDDPRAQNSTRPAALRRGCVWTGPAEAPYLGTLAAALSAARMPDAIVRKFEIMREGRLVTDRLEITSAGIATLDHRRTFGRVASAMTLGEIVCFSTRVNPPAGTVHAADLYETLDDDGRRYAIMILALSGNVAVLGELSER